MSTIQKTKLHFSVAGHITQLLGRQAILNETMAIFELCKNGYDAEATKVDVFFEDVSGPNGRIRIVDNGDGMTEEDIRKKFMVIATSSRTREKKTSSGRIVSGEKGIGRFAMERLSHRTIIYSYPKNESKAYKITIEWDRYELEDITLNEVGNDFEPIEKKDPNRSGVEIVCEVLRDVMNETKIKKIEKHLRLLVAPEGFPVKLPFNITLNAPEYDITSKSLKSGWFDKAPFKFEGRLDGNGRGAIQVWYKGEKIVGATLDHKRCKNGFVIDDLTKCGPVIYKMWGFPKDSTDEEKWQKWYGSSIAPNLLDWVDNNQGVRIYRDEFRVLPYGEPDNDWTNRAAAARKLAGVLPKKNIVGWVKISQEDNPGLIPSATRFHLIEDDDGPYTDLKKFVMECDQILDRIMHDERVEERKKKQKNIPLELEKIAKKVRGLKELPDEIKRPLSREITENATYLKNEQQEVKKTEERLMSKLEAYRDLASLGIQTSVVSHEVSQELGNLIALSELFERRLRANSLTKNQLYDIQSDLSSSIRFIRDYMTLVKNFTSALKGDQEEFRKKSVINIKKEIEFYVDRMSTLLERYNIRVINLIPNVFDIYMYRADFQSIIFNLFSNSIKGIIRQRSKLDDLDRAKKQNTIKINLDPNPSTAYVGLVFSDDGTGVRPAIQDRIFDLFFSDYNRPGEVLKGSGLGLTLVQEIVEGYGGNIELIENEFKPGASFLIKFRSEEIKVPKSEIKNKTLYQEDNSFKVKPILLKPKIKTRSQKTTKKKTKKRVLRKSKSKKKKTKRKKI